MNFREITEADIPDLFAVRVATHENRLTREELISLGITEESVTEKFNGSFKGWLCDVEGQVVGFAMGDKTWQNTCQAIAGRMEIAKRSYRLSALRTAAGALRTTMCCHADVHKERQEKP